MDSTETHYDWSHPELVVTTFVSTIAGKISELSLKGWIIDVPKSSTKTVLRMVATKKNG